MNLRLNIRNSHLELVLPIFVLVVVLSLSSPHFFNLHNFNNIGNQIAINLIIGLGMTLVITSGGIDLSVGSNVALTGVLVAQFFQLGFTGAGATIVGILIGLASGTVIGCINGLIISYLKVPPFICTLGTMTSLRGIALLASNGRPIMGMPDQFLHVFSGFSLAIPRPVITAAIMIVVAAFILNRTTLGRRITAIGGNERCVVVCGINVKFSKILIYGMTGLLAGLAGLVLTTTMATAEPLAGIWYELDAIAIVVMGGTSLKGGKGTILGTILGAILLGLVRNGLNLLKIHATYHTLIVGLLILFSVILTSDIVADRAERLWDNVKQPSRKIGHQIKEEKL